MARSSTTWQPGQDPGGCPQGPRPKPLELKRLRQQLREGSPKVVAALERHLESPDLTTKDLVPLAKLWLEWSYGKPGTQAEEEARVPVDLAKLPPAERVAALERRAEDLRELAEREARGIQ